MNDTEKYIAQRCIAAMMPDHPSTKRTPGEWYVEDASERPLPHSVAIPIRIYSDAPGRSLPFTVAMVEGCAGIDGDVGRGNARLIAAAPKMYEALKTLMDRDIAMPPSVISDIWDIFAAIEGREATTP